REPCDGHLRHPAPDQHRKEPTAQLPGERQDQEDAHDIADEPRNEQEQTTEQNQSGISQLLPWHPAGVDGLAQGSPGASTLPPDQGESDHDDEEEQGQRPPRTDSPAHGDQDNDLQQQKQQHTGEDEPESSGRPTATRPAVPASPVSAMLLSTGPVSSGPA